MRVAITGHTSGIGKALYQHFKNNGSEVFGFSRSTGFDISKQLDRDQILDVVWNCDVFINNAYHSTGQEDLLREVIAMWDGSNKSIINISSNIKILNEAFFQVNKAAAAYRNVKSVLDYIISQYRGSIYILNVLPGPTKTNFNLLSPSKRSVMNGMDVEYVAEKIYNAFQAKQRNELIIKYATWLSEKEYQYAHE